MNLCITPSNLHHIVNETTDNKNFLYILKIIRCQRLPEFKMAVANVTKPVNTTRILKRAYVPFVISC